MCLVLCFTWGEAKGAWQEEGEENLLLPAKGGEGGRVREEKLFCSASGGKDKRWRKIGKEEGGKRAAAKCGGGGAGERRRRNHGRKKEERRRKGDPGRPRRCMHS